MNLSDEAKKLLDEGNVSALQELRYERLLPEKFRIEPLDTRAYFSLKKSCVLSSGQIVSKKTAENLFKDGIITHCPITDEVLNPNIGETGIGYVRIPKLDLFVKDLRQKGVDPA